MLSKPVQRLATLLTIVAALIAIGQVFAPVRNWTGKHASELYPVGWLVIEGVVIIVLLAMALMSARRASALRRALAGAEHAAAAVERDRDEARAELASLRRDLDRDRQAHDRRILGEIQTALPRNVIRFFAEHDMGNAWRRDYTYSLINYSDNMNQVEHRFLDPELEQLRSELFHRAKTLTQLMVLHSAPSMGNPEWADIGPDPDLARNAEDEERFRELFEERRGLLNDAGDEFVAAYDALIVRATEKLPG